MFRRHSLDVSDVMRPDGTNLLAVLVHPPDHPGRIPAQGGQGGDHEVCKSSSSTLHPKDLVLDVLMLPDILYFTLDWKRCRGTICRGLGLDGSHKVIYLCL